MLYLWTSLCSYSDWVLSNKVRGQLLIPAFKQTQIKVYMCVCISVCVFLLSLFSHPVMSITLQPQGLQNSTALCLSPSPKVCPRSYLLHQWCQQPTHPLMPSPSSALNLPIIKDFSRESAVCIRFSFSFSISPSNEYSGLISLKIHWFHLSAVQKTLRSLLQHHCLKASIGID